MPAQLVIFVAVTRQTLPDTISGETATQQPTPPSTTRPPPPAPPSPAATPSA